MLPMGEGDWAKGSRWDFLKGVLPTLCSYGWTIGVEAKGARLGGWAEECCRQVREFGGRFTWHPPAGVAEGMGREKTILERLRIVAEDAIACHPLGLEAVTIHCAPAISKEPAEDAGWERYNSQLTAQEMLCHIIRQVDPLRQLNLMMNELLHIENVDCSQFSGRGYRMPTYLALQTGSWLDLWFLSATAGVKTTFDSEHFYGARCLLTRIPPFDSLFSAVGPCVGSPVDRAMVAIQALDGIAGYELDEGHPPRTKQDIDLSNYTQLIQPRLYHFGASTMPFDEEGRINTHLPFSSNDSNQMADLQFQLYRIMKTNALGAVIEVNGQLEPEKYSPWSPRPQDDEVAKMLSFLVVCDQIAKLKKAAEDA